MDRWEPLYLRGFAAGEYTGRSWQPLEGEALAAQSDTLYTLQRDYFFPSTQVSAAWQDVSGGESRTVTVANAGACRQRLYLPYGAATDALDAADLTGEGAASRRTPSPCPFTRWRTAISCRTPCPGPGTTPPIARGGGIPPVGL